MKKACSAALLVFAMFALRIAAFADAAPIPKNYRMQQALGSPAVPIVIAVVIIAVVILVKVLRSKKQK